MKFPIILFFFLLLFSDTKAFSSHNYNYEELLKQIQEKKKLIADIIYNDNPNINKQQDKITNLMNSVEKIVDENQKLKPMIKNISEMQYNTYQQIKGYENQVEEFKLKLQKYSRYNNDKDYKDDEDNNNENFIIINKNKSPHKKNLRNNVNINNFHKIKNSNYKEP
jgi:hypothetical protein